MTLYFFYGRCSSVGQNPSRQVETFRQHGKLEANNVFIDRCTGEIPFRERPEAVKLFEAVTSQPKDVRVTIVVDSVCRIGRNLIDILQSIQTFTKLGISVKSVKEGFETLLEDGKESPIALVLLATLGAVAQLERERIRQRQAEGIAINKAMFPNKYSGRKIGSVQTPQRLLERYPIVVNKLKKGLTIADICSITGHSSTTVMKVKKAMANQS
jgi:DNA invertase Pin-like site-specific DNA recombinase